MLVKQRKINKQRKNNSLLGRQKEMAGHKRIKKEVVAKPSRPAASPLVQKTTPSYFVPKYILASVIPEEQEPSFTEEELLKAMKKIGVHMSFLMMNQRLFK